MKKFGIVSLVVLLLLTVGSADAQEQMLDPNAVPDHGIAAGGAGFQPDPFRVEGVTGGGDIEANSRNLGVDCIGAISVQPDFRFTALTPFDLLRFIFVADAVTSDASLVVRDAKGDFHCNDDSYGVHNPTVEIANAPPGDYNVWVGARSDRVFGDLYVTTHAEISVGTVGLIIPRPTAEATAPPTATPIPHTALNPTLGAIFGTDDLTAGFLPDPYYRVVTAGGALAVSDSAAGDECVGYTTSAPAFRVNWSGDSTRLRFLFAPLNDDRDAALIVQDPGGAWLCNRDFAGGYTRPQVEYINPVEGMYAVWVSDEIAPDDPMTGILYVTEKQYSPETVRQAGTLPTSAPIEGLTPGTSAFAFDASAPDPYAVPGALSGGDLDIGAQIKDCPGTYTALPSFGFLLPEPTPYLRVFYAADDPKADAALIVLMPDGTWYCNDDSFNSKAPTVDVIGNTSTGGVSVWIGSFNPGETLPGTLYLTRGGANPIDPTRPAPVTAGQ